MGLPFPQVIHSTVVDTSVLFPHRLGLPYKRSLRNLMADYLRQIIQDNGEWWVRLGWGRAQGLPTLILCLLHSGRPQLQRGRQRLHAPGDLEGPRRRQDQAVTAAHPPPASPAALACLLAPGLFQNSAINLES